VVGIDTIFEFFTDTAKLQYARGFARCFGRSSKSASGQFPVIWGDFVLGVQLNGVKKAYPFSGLKKLPAEVEEDRLGCTPIRIHFDSKNESAFVTDREGNAVPAVVLFWFAWRDFYPDTLVFAADQD